VRTEVENSAASAPQRKLKNHVNNTAAPSSLNKRLTRQLAGILAHLERNPKDVLSQARVSTIQDLLRR
jgi:hypothetical protein